MKKTIQEFREEKKAQFKTTMDWVDKNYETICELSRVAKVISPIEGFRVDTPYGAVQFVPGLTKLED
jgi:hypothetical protein